MIAAQLLLCCVIAVLLATAWAAVPSAFVEQGAAPKKGGAPAAKGGGGGGAEPWWLKDVPWFLPPPPEWGPMPPTMYTSYWHRPVMPALSTPNYYPLFSRAEEYYGSSINPTAPGAGLFLEEHSKLTKSKKAKKAHKAAKAAAKATKATKAAKATKTAAKATTSAKKAHKAGSKKGAGSSDPNYDRAYLLYKQWLDSLLAGVGDDAATQQPDLTAGAWVMPGLPSQPIPGVTMGIDGMPATDAAKQQAADSATTTDVYAFTRWLNGIAKMMQKQQTHDEWARTHTPTGENLAGPDATLQDEGNGPNAAPRSPPETFSSGTWLSQPTGIFPPTPGFMLPLPLADIGHAHAVLGADASTLEPAANVAQDEAEDAAADGATTADAAIAAAEQEGVDAADQAEDDASGDAGLADLLQHAALKYPPFRANGRPYRPNDFLWRSMAGGDTTLYHSAQGGQWQNVKSYPKGQQPPQQTASAVHFPPKTAAETNPDHSK